MTSTDVPHVTAHATTTAEHTTHWVEDWARRHGVDLAPAAKGAMRDLLVHQTAELERGHFRFNELIDERNRVRNERDQKAATLARVLAECDAIDTDMHAVRDVTARIRAAIEGPTQ